MSLVTAGLGRSYAGELVLRGLGREVSIVPPAPAPSSGGGVRRRPSLVQDAPPVRLRVRLVSPRGSLRLAFVVQPPLALDHMVVASPAPQVSARFEVLDEVALVLALL